MISNPPPIDYHSSVDRVGREFDAAQELHAAIDESQEEEHEFLTREQRELVNQARPIEKLMFEKLEQLYKCTLKLQVMTKQRTLPFSAGDCSNNMNCCIFFFNFNLRFIRSFSLFNLQIPSGRPSRWD